MNSTTVLPSADEMYAALVARDSQYEGVFFVAVKTTGVFCRPTCTARKPHRRNIEFFPCTAEALAAGFRPCRRCRPLEALGDAPPWIAQLLQQVDQDVSRRWTDGQLREMGIRPERLRRWFKQHHGITFQSYLRSRRMSGALGQISVGQSVTGAALDNGYDSLSGFRDAFQKWCGEVPGSVKQGASPIIVSRIPSPLGPMVVAAGDDGICLLEFADRRMLETQFKRLVRLTGRPLATGDHQLINRLACQLQEYFAGARTEFDVPIQLAGSPFQMAVWRELLNIPYGRTKSYEQLATAIGKPGAQRAVGRANGDNRLAIAVPCHRVIRSDGTLSGYGGGVWRKKRLLQLEQHQTRLD